MSGSNVQFQHDFSTMIKGETVRDGRHHAHEAATDGGEQLREWTHSQRTIIHLWQEKDSEAS